MSDYGSWGNGEYRDIFVTGGYAYMAAREAGLDIIDVHDPDDPVKLGQLPNSLTQTSWKR